MRLHPDNHLICRIQLPAAISLELETISLLPARQLCPDVLGHFLLVRRPARPVCGRLQVKSFDHLEGDQVKHLDHLEGSYSREEDLEKLADKSVAEERRLVHLTDGSQETTLAVHTKREEVVFHILKTGPNVKRQKFESQYY